jgi:hypothetical protein
VLIWQDKSKLDGWVSFCFAQSLAQGFAQKRGSFAQHLLTEELVHGETPTTSRIPSYWLLLAPPRPSA